MQPKPQSLVKAEIPDHLEALYSNSCNHHILSQSSHGLGQASLVENKSDNIPGRKLITATSRKKRQKR